MARKLIYPTDEENKQINQGIASDPDMPEWNAKDLARARPAKHVLPPAAYAAAVKRYRGQRGPQKKPTKKPVTLRLDPDVLETYKATGRGWQKRINDVLRRGIDFVKPSPRRG